MTVSFVVIGTPKPQPRPRACRRGSHVHMYDPGTADDWRQSVAIEARKIPAGGVFIVKPCRVSIVFYLPRPKSLAKSIRYHTKKPDIDNLIKSTLDAMTQAAIWPDDSCVVEILARKEYCDDQDPGALINIFSLS